MTRSRMPSTHSPESAAARGAARLSCTPAARSIAACSIRWRAWALRVAGQIARSLDGVPVAISGADKAAYHATAVLAAGSGFALIEAAARMLEKIGFTRRRALETLLPLARQMLDNVERLGPRAAWTGPLSRGDFAVIAKHEKALRRFPREFQQSYAALALLAARVLAKNPEATLRRLRRALNLRA